MNPEYALIVAGGKGIRVGGETPKQFLELNGIPILIHTIRAFQRYSTDVRIILVLPESQLTFWEKLAAQHGVGGIHSLQTGGETRFESVKRGLEKVGSEGLVAIHDGVRPLVSEEIIAASYRLASVHGSAVAAVRLKESIRTTDKDGTRSVDRSQFRLIQTPQTFRIDLIRQAYSIQEDPSLTDDASVAERSGHKISLFEGSYTNIKITTPEDLAIAEALMKLTTTGGKKRG